MFEKMLVANRGEIAIRGFRAAYELGIKTVAVFAYEDRNSEHRLKADEAYEIGERGHPVRAYLDPAGIVAAATRAGADAVYPGYGFLSENPALAQACADAGVTFVGPPAGVLRLTGNKASAIGAARRAGLPVLSYVDPSDDVDEIVGAVAGLTFPVFVKAVAGGGGRGMRRVDQPDALRRGGRPQRCARPRRRSATHRVRRAGRRRPAAHRGAGPGRRGRAASIHLYERDCSVQRRHQKVIEIAPAPNLDPCSATGSAPMRSRSPGRSAT